MTTDYKDTVLISKKKELRKINCRHFVFLYVFSLMGASRPLAPRCFQVQIIKVLIFLGKTVAYFKKSS